MGTLLRVLVISILVLSGSALFLAVKLYGKRELLVNRTHLLEEQVRKIAKTIEAAETPDTAQPSFPAKDISPVTGADVETPERSTFWSTYPYKLETPNLPAMNLDTEARQLQLRKYYQTKTTPEGKDELVKDPLNPGEYSTKGPGTMQELLDQVLDRAVKQNATLNKTRVELQKVREELVATIEDYNKIKQDARADKKGAAAATKDVENSKDENRTLARKVSGLEEEKKTIAGDLTDAKAETEKSKAVVEGLTQQIKDRDKDIKKLSEKKALGMKEPASAAPAVESFQGAPGDKGKIVAVDEKLKFVVVELTDEAMTELVGKDRDRPMPQVDLMVRRPGFKSAAGEFITRIKFRQIMRQKNLVVADILTDWQQAPVEKNDVVFF